ncbi:MAG TPA: hypothetical protein VFK02_16980 [Kofleriaceae bacterium]|nr:hypothetical protein [Kofleriaceae bacterium]
MIEVDPEAALELLDARDYYQKARSGLGAVFELAAQRTLDAIEAAPERYPLHRFARTPGVRRALFLPPPRFPYALSYLLRPGKGPYVLAAEHFRREPMYWAIRLRSFVKPGG